MKTNTLFFLPLSFLLFVFSQNCFASHIRGHELSFTHISDLKYQITVTEYNDWLSIWVPFNLQITCGYMTTSISGLQLVNTDTLILSNKAIAKYGASVEIDFATSPYSAFSNCDSIVLEYHFSSNVIANNSTTSTRYNYVSTNLFISPKTINSTPILSVNPIFDYCCNQPANLALGAIDADGDSLSYSWGRAMNYIYNSAVPSTYNTQHTFNYPVKAYFPGSIQPPFANPNVDPPIGAYLNLHTGEVTYTPIDCTEKPLVVVNIHEWRQDSSGVPKLLSTSSRVMTFQVSNCLSNFTPKLSEPRLFSVCKDDSISFTINSTDEVYVPAPPATKTPPDDVNIYWNHGITNATFTVINDTAKAKSAQFFWQTDSSTEADKTYYFTVWARDNNTTGPRECQKTYGISVYDEVRTKIVKPFENCNRIRYSDITNTTCIPGKTLYSWAIEDSTGQNITNDVQIISKSGLTSSNDFEFVVHKPNKYIVKRIIYNDLNTYSDTFYDTLDRLDILQLQLNITDSLLCVGNQIQLNPTLKNSKGSVSFLWLKDTTVLLDVSSTLITTPIQKNQTSTYMLTATDSRGCTALDSCVTRNMDLSSNLSSEINRCNSDSTYIQIDSGYSNILWSNGNNNFAFVPRESGLYSVTYNDSNNCKYTDSVSIILSKPLYQNWDDTIKHCSKYPLSIESVSASTYLWNTGSSLKQILTLGGKISISVTDSMGCITSDSCFVIIHKPLEVNLVNDTTLCANTIDVDAGVFEKYQWNTGFNGRVLTVNNSGVFKVNVVDSNGCTSIDSVKINLLFNEPPILQQNGNRITSNKIGLHRWFLNDVEFLYSNSRSVIVNGEGTYTATHVDVFDCESDTSNAIQFTADISKLSLPKINTYPNPNGGSFTLEIPNELNANDLHINLVNAVGKEVNLNVERNGSSLQLSTQAVPGVYFLFLRSEKESFYQKVVVR